MKYKYGIESVNILMHDVAPQCLCELIVFAGYQTKTQLNVWR